MNDIPPPASDIEAGYETPDDELTHPSLITAAEEHKEAIIRRRRRRLGKPDAPIPGGGRTRRKRKRIKRRKSGSGLFTKKNKKMIDGMSEGTIKRLSNSDTSFAAIIRARTKTREGIKGLKAYRDALGNKTLKEKDLKALPNFLKWQKKQEIPIATKAFPVVDAPPLVDAVPLVDGVPVTKKFVDNTVPLYRRGGRRTRRKRRKTKHKRRRKTKRKKRRRKKRKTRRSKTRRSRRKKQHGGSVELENWRPTASYGFNGAGEFSKKIPTDSYPNFTTNPARY
jgi:hypothetical protein